MNFSCGISNDERESNTEMHKSWAHIWCRLAKVNCKCLNEKRERKKTLL